MRALLYCIALMGAMLVGYYTWPEGILYAAIGFGLVCILIFSITSSAFFDLISLVFLAGENDRPTSVPTKIARRNYILWGDDQLLEKLSQPWISSADRDAIESELRSRGLI